MTTFTLILLSNVAISLVSLVGLVALTVSKTHLNKWLIFLVAFSAGTMMGGAFLHLIPEAGAALSLGVVNRLVLCSFVAFFLVEKLLRWHHHHDFVADKHVLGLMNLTGDAFHNFLDGLIIAAAFYTDMNLGFVTVLAVILHEIPQEIGDFGVLLHSGFSIGKALLANLLVALLAVLGGIVGFVWVSHVGSIAPYITAFAAGGFVYIATSDLLPEIRQENTGFRSWLSFLVFLAGVGLMVLV